MPCARLRTGFLIAIVASSSIAAIAACSTDEDGSASQAAQASEIRKDKDKDNNGRNDGKDRHATNPGKLSCEDHGGPPGVETAVDLGGVNRTLDIGDGDEIKVFGVKKGQEWTFNYESDRPIKLILIRSGNQVSKVEVDSKNAESGSVSREDAEGPTKTGLNRIAFCFKPKPPPCTGKHCPPPPCDGKHCPPPPCDGKHCPPPPPPNDAGPPPCTGKHCPPQRDGGSQTW